jgi:hypothetical protein
MTGKLVISAALLCVSCGRPDLDLPPVIREGERVVLGTDIDVDVCAGTVALLDAHVASVEATLGVPRRPGKIPVYVFGNDEDVKKRCSRAHEGCFIPHEGGGPASIVSAGNYEAVYHEIVHDICQNSQIGRPPDFLTEAIAFALAASDTFAFRAEGCFVVSESERSLDELFDRFDRKEWDGHDGLRVGRFILHLLNTYGPRKLVAWAGRLQADDGPQDMRRSFKQAYGRSLDKEWAVQDDSALPRVSHACLLAPKLAWRDGRAEHDFTTGCDDSTVETLFDAPGYRRSRVVIERSKNDEFYAELDGPVGQSVTMHLCGTCEIITSIDLAEHDYRGSGSLNLFDEGRFLVNRVAKVESDGPLRLAFGLWPPPPECDAREKNCPFGEKCQFFTRNRVSCEPLPGDPLPEGAICSDLTRSADPCEMGLECPLYVARCVPLCAGAGDDPGCRSGEICLESRENYPGVCVTECDPFRKSCPADQVCAFFDGNFLCSSYPEIANGLNRTAGDECFFACGGEMYCASSKAVRGCTKYSDGGCCTPYCDLTAAEPTARCSTDQPRCAPLTDTVGYCSAE